MVPWISHTPNSRSKMDILTPLKDSKGPFLEVLRTFRAQKAIRKITTCLFCKADLFICRKGNKNKNNCKVSCLGRLGFEDTKRIMSPEILPKSFGTFEKRATDYKPLVVFLQLTSFVPHVSGGHCLVHGNKAFSMVFLHHPG